MKTPGSPSVTTIYFGDSGGSTTYYYWVQACYTWGYGIMSLASIVVGSTLSSRNVVQISWNPMPYAVAYNVYRTLSATAPTGTGAFAIAIDYATAGGLVDNGITLMTLTVPSGAVNITSVEDLPKDHPLETAPNPTDEQIAEERARYLRAQEIANQKQMAQQWKEQAEAREKEEKEEKRRREEEEKRRKTEQLPMPPPSPKEPPQPHK